MTTNKPETFRFDCHGHSAPAYSCNKPADNSGEYVRLSDYEALQAECEKLRTLLAAAPDVQGEPVGRQYFQHGKWWNGDGLTKKQQKDLEEEGVRFRNVYAAPQPAKQPVEQQPAAKAQMEVVGWQFYQDGQWWNGDDRIKDHRKNTVAAGMPVRDVYAAPQPEPDVAVLVEAVARAICTACDENPDFRGDARGNEYRWQDYQEIAEAAMAAGIQCAPGQTTSQAKAKEV